MRGGTWGAIALVMLAAFVMLLSSTLVGTVQSTPLVAAGGPSVAVAASPSATHAASTPAAAVAKPSVDLSREALVNRARQAFIDNNVSLTDFLPPNLNAAPGPVSETGNHVVPLYSYAAAPIGISTFGLRNSSGTTTPYILNTTSLEGTFSTGDPLGLQVLSPYYGTLQAYGDQLNTVLNNTTILGKGGYDYWLQNVITYTTSTNSLSLLLNIWNFSSPSGIFPSNSILHGNGRVESSEVYETSGPKITVAYPFTLDLYLNTTVGSYSGSPKVNEVYFNYTVFNSAHNVVCPTTEPTGDVCGEYDNVYFNSGTTVSSGSAQMQANGYQYTPLGLPSDMEMDVGIGQSDGANANVVYANATVGLYVLNATTRTYQAPPSAYDFGSETGETGIGAYTTWNTVGGQPVAYLRTGPSLLTGLWNVTGPTDGAPTLDTGAQGAYALNYASVTPGNAFLAIAQGAGVTNQSYFQVAPTFGWYTGKGALGKNIWLQPGTYTVEVMLSGYTESTSTVVLSSNQSLSVSLTHQATPTVYTPLWAFSASDLGNLSTSGAGTAGSPYVLVGAQTGSLAPVFAVQNDYLFIVYSGIWINHTSAYFEFNPPPSLEVSTPSWWQAIDAGLEASYGNVFLFNQLPMYFYEPSNFVVENGASIGLWSSDIEVGHNYAVYCNLCSSSLFASNVFNVSSEGIDFLGSGTAQHNYVWGNTFLPYTAPGAGAEAPGPAGTYGGVSAPSTGLTLAEGGDHVYNNAFYTNHTLTSTSTSLLNYYNATGGYYQPASDAVTVLGLTLSGGILGGSLQGGNYYRDYGALPDPYGVLPYVGRASSPTGTAEIGDGGDHAPLATLPGDCTLCLPGQGLYHLTFTESGLKSGTSWTMKVAGVPVYEPALGTTYHTGPTNTSTTTTAGFWLPNGTYTWTVSTVPSGYAATPPTGSITVSGATLGVSVQFATGYTQTVTESGLPSGAVWWVNVTGRLPVSGTVSGSAKTISVVLPNGTFSYAVGGVPGWTVTSGSASGSITVNGANPSPLSVTFSPAYVVTFTETGLPAGTEWFVNLTTGASYSGTAGAISFASVNGSYTYTIGNTRPSFGAAAGGFSVSGSSVSVPVTFSEIFVTPYASPNPTQPGATVTVYAGATGGSGTYVSYVWSGSVPSGCSLPSGTTTGSFSCTPGPSSQGAYPISVLVTDSNGAHFSGTFGLTVTASLVASLSASPATTQVTGTSVLTLSFSGGVAPYTWSLTENGSSSNLTGATPFTCEVGGPTCYHYAFTPTQPGTYTFELSASDSVGSPSVATTTVTVEPALTATLVATPSTTQVTGTSELTLTLAGGVAPVTWTLEMNGSSANLSGAVGRSYDFTPTAPGVYTFYLNATDAVDSTSNAVAVVTVEPALSASVTSSAAAIDVGQTALITVATAGGVAPVTWTLTESGSAANLTTVIDGSCTFAPTAAGTYTFYLNASDSVGSGASSTTTITVSPALVVAPYALLNPVDSGQPNTLYAGVSGGSGVVTSIVWSGLPASCTNTTGPSVSCVAYGSGQFDVVVHVQDSNGNVVTNGFTLVVEPQLGTGTPSATPNPVLVGAATTISTTGATGGLAPYMYTWTGLPTGCSNPGNVTSFVCTPTAPGLYTVYVTVTDALGFTATQGFQLNVGSVYVVTFSETGLPGGTLWYVNVTGGPALSGTTSTLSTALANGTYAYKVATSDKNLGATGGEFTIAGEATTAMATFAPLVYPVTVTETGLPSSVLSKDGWQVYAATPAGLAHPRGELSSVTFASANGTIGILITGPSGWQVEGPSGEVPVGVLTVAGNTTLHVSFVKGKTVTLTATSKGLATGQQWCVSLEGAYELCSTGKDVKFFNLTPAADYPFAVVSPLSGQTITAKVGATTAKGTDGLLLQLALEKSTTVALTFVYAYAVTFTETGLPPGGTWSVTVKGVKLSNATGEPIVFELGNGTYSFTFQKISGYTSVATPSKVEVHGSAASVVIVYTAKKGSVPAVSPQSGRPASSPASELVGEVVLVSAILGMLGAAWVLRSGASGTRERSS